MSKRRTKTDEIEREIEGTKSGLNRDIEALQNRFSIGRLLDQFMGLFRGGDNIGAGIGEKVRNNPLPVALVGIGIGWLIMSSRDGSGPGGREQLSSAARGARDQARSARETATEAGHRAGAAMGEARERAGEAIDGAIEGARSGAVRGGHAAERFVQENPLVVAGLALAAGAALGAMLPTTRREREWLGERSEEVRHSARQAAAEGTRKVKEAASEVARSAAEEMERQVKGEAADDIPAARSRSTTNGSGAKTPNAAGGAKSGRTSAQSGGAKTAGN